MSEQVAAALTPTTGNRRLQTLDAVRGFALLGILVVNAQLFAEPFQRLMDPSWATDSLASRVVQFLTIGLAAGKFYPLFSLLFGVGLALILQSAQKAGRSFGWLALRRLAALACFGIAHILLLWPGDILLIYAVAGLLMVWFVRFTPRTLLVLAGVFFAIAAVIPTGMAALQAIFTERPPEGAQPMPTESSAVLNYLAVIQDAKGGGPLDPRLATIETQIFRDGPYRDALVMRLINYGFSLIYVLTTMLWQVWAMFCLGAALLKLGFFHADARAGGTTVVWRRRILRAGLLVGLTMSLAAAALYTRHEDVVLGPMTVLFMQVGGPLLSLAYLVLIMRSVERGGAIWRVIAAAGSMALTCYLLESVIMSAIFQHWGLAMFDRVTWAQRGLIVLGVYVAVLAFAWAWTRAFRFGPMEWMWRTLTYLKSQPMGTR